MAINMKTRRRLAARRASAQATAAVRAYRRAKARKQHPEWLNLENRVDHVLQMVTRINSQEMPTWARQVDRLAGECQNAGDMRLAGDLRDLAVRMNDLPRSRNPKYDKLKVQAYAGSLRNRLR